ncbi:acetyl-coenzyme A synthetase [Rhizopus microsporus var. microsporus]|uniref:Acetyl-coenzyme A synthetase n=2 Tax=Rhizopus microsporus TaxID=58291 RepID=A0A2G4SJH7_RHIZD|nr:acyl-activating enzyme [Rhizopus microsporus ATCC 52813]ORE03498.1 acetyl-coenzyme A synthetase [Rhizopus microsporus var. microsporus]PHZ08902.1 acyl-activating enzyme [Rhizopus microsporus ATCC 52813]
MTVEENIITHPVPPRLLDTSKYPKPHIHSMDTYKALWKESVEHPEEFFAKYARELLSWSKPFETVRHGSLAHGDIGWFLEGELNACYNCVDRHALKNPNKIAIIHEGDEPDQVRNITYGELFRLVCQMANTLKNLGVRKGDNVAIYMPMIPEALVAALACARIGAVHSVVFAGFSAESLRDRIIDCAARVVITSDEGRRGGKNIATKRIVDEALRSNQTHIEHVIVFRRTGSPIDWVEDRDLWWHEEMAKARTFCPPEPMNAEDPLFLLYTSGSTGAPKGILHTTGGYLLGAALTVKYIFDYHENDIFACMADIGWITGHTYVNYGPLTLGGTTVLFESTPTYPDPSRFWRLVEKHKVTQFYTAPTAIRALRRLGDEWVDKCDLSSLRVIGSVGEPINPEAWEWYYKKVGRSQCAVVDTYWQTETGSIVIAPLPGVTPTKAGSATLPFFGIKPVILDPTTGKVLEGNDVTGVLAISQPWPSMARTVYNNHARFLETYLHPYNGYYFTGDGATRDKDGYIWIRGRVDDVINVSGHRLSTAEIESALILHHSVAEAAVVGGHDDLTGQCIHAFAVLKPNIEDSEGFEKELTLQVRKVIGPFATPKRIYVVTDLPKTRSGKIMRRILRKIVNGEQDSLGDTSTLADPSVVDQLIKRVIGKK